MHKPDSVIFDMDGTLADVSGIRHFVMDKNNKNFDKFHSHSIDCPPNDWVVDLAHQFQREGLTILIVTARSQMWFYHTFFWLIENSVPFDDIFMRVNKDYRKDYLVKKDILSRIQSRYNPIIAVDDNPAVLKLWEESHIPTIIQVPGWLDTNPATR